MTIRTIIDRKIKKIMLAIFIGFGVFIAGMIIHIVTNTKGPPIISLVGFGVAFFSIWYAFLGIRCPNCNMVIGYMAMYKGLFIPDSIFTMSKKIKYCVFCGVNMDTESPNQPK